MKLMYHQLINANIISANIINVKYRYIRNSASFTNKCQAIMKNVIDTKKIHAQLMSYETNTVILIMLILQGIQ